MSDKDLIGTLALGLGIYLLWDRLAFTAQPDLDGLDISARFTWPEPMRKTLATTLQLPGRRRR